MSNSEQSNTPQLQLWNLVRSLDMNLLLEPDKDHDSYRLQGPANHENFNKMQVLVGALRDAELINYAGHIGLEELRQGLVIENSEIKLDMQVKNNGLEILLKTKDLSKVKIDGFNRAVDNAIKLLSTHKQGNEAMEPHILNMPSQPPARIFGPAKTPLSLVQSTETEIICGYLRKKTEAAFPCSKPEVTYTQTDHNFGAPAFNVIFSYPDGKDRTALSHFKGALSEVSGTHNISHFRINRDDSRIGVTLSGNPVILVGNITRNEHDKALLAHKTSHSR